MTLSKRQDYGHSKSTQAPKGMSIAKAKALVQQIQKALKPFVDSCEIYKSDESIGDAPAVRIDSNRLAIAPDLKCVSKGRRVFWVEVKDKSQRFYYPDTGADLHQVLGWYDIWKHLNEPVLLVFQDPELESCMPKAAVPNLKRMQFKKRWHYFEGSPYGNWLSDCLLIKDNYPRIFAERSRDLDMYIFYFHIYRMISLNNSWEQMTSNFDHGAVSALPDSIRAYFPSRLRLLDEREIRKLAIRQ